MKKGILFIFAAALLSCKKETPQTNQCDCAEVTYLKWIYTQQQWEEQSRGATVKMDCWKHGEITQEWQGSHAGNPQWYKKQIVCE